MVFTELSFWEQYGPRIVVCVFIIVAAFLIARIGYGAARAQARIAGNEARHFNGCQGGTQKKIVEKYEKNISERVKKAVQYRGVADVVTMFSIPFVFFLVIRSLLELTPFSSNYQWVVSIACLVAVMTATIWVIRKNSMGFRGVLDADTELKMK